TTRPTAAVWNFANSGPMRVGGGAESGCAADPDFRKGPAFRNRSCPTSPSSECPAGPPEAGALEGDDGLIAFCMASGRPPAGQVPSPSNERAGTPEKDRA